MRLREHGAYGLGMIAVGAAGGAFASAFKLLAHHVFEIAAGKPDVLSSFRAAPWWLRVLVPAGGGLLAGLVGELAARRAGGHGVAEILEAVALGRGRVSVRTALLKALGSFLAISSGGSIGREGPIVQFGAAAGNALGPKLGLSPRQIRALIAAGAGAGFAAAYNTPIAAIVFVLEIVTGAIALDVVFPVVVAVTAATALARWASGGGPLYGARAFELVSDLELGAHALLGVLSGLGGVAFMALLGKGEHAGRSLGIARPLRGALGGALLGLLLIPLPEVAGNGFEAIQLVLDGKTLPWLLAVLLVAKAVATVISVSSGSPGGVFTPSLFLGATIGGLVGHAVRATAPFGAQVVPGGYALVGMAAVIAATTHAPLMATVLAFELSGDYSIVLPLLLATSIATSIARRLKPDSIYTEELRRRGVDSELLRRDALSSPVDRLEPPRAPPDQPSAAEREEAGKPGEQADASSGKHQPGDGQGLGRHLACTGPKPMKRRALGGLFSGLLASASLAAGSAVAASSGLLDEPPFAASWRPVVEMLPGGSTPQLAASAALSILSGGAWGVIYEALVRRSTPFTGAMFGVMPTLWLGLVTMPLTGRAPLGLPSPEAMLVPLTLNCLLWGPLLGLLARPSPTPRPQRVW